MQVRVDQLVPYGYTDTAISTFHAFGDRLIREFALELGLPSDVRVFSRPETVVFLREHVFELGLDEYRPLGDPTKFLDALATLFSRAKDEDVSPEAFLAHAEGLAARAAAAAQEAAAPARPPPGDRCDPDAAAALAEEARKRGELARAYGVYQRLLAANGAIDFGDQVSLALRLLRESPSAREQVQERFKYVLVDEFQDTNRAQAELVALVAQRHRNVTVVGDDDQSIYKFRGAAISNILEFRERYRNAKVVVLRRNYRSRGPILDASYRLVRHNDPDRLEVRAGIVKKLVAERGSDGAPAVRHEAFASGAEEADWIAADIARRVREGGAPRDVAILVRANAAADPVLRSLNLEGIPWRFSGTSGLYARPEVRLLLSFLRAVADPNASTDVYGLAASELYGMGGEDLVSIVNMARRRNRSVFEILEELGRQPGILRLTPDTRARAARLVEDLRAYIALAHERPAGEVLYAFLRGTGWLKRLAETESVAAEEALSNIARFFDIVRAQSALLADDRAVFFARHLQTLIQAGDDPPTADIDPDADAVAVMTVHKAKGLEFPVVYLPGLVTGRFPATGRREQLALPVELVNETLPEGDYQLQEERRLFYVGMTRARDELVLSHAADYGGQRARRVSPFVLEALDLPVAAGASGSGAALDDPARAARRQRAAGAVAGGPAVAGRGAAAALVLRHRRLPDLPAQVQVRARAAGAARAPPLAHLRLRAPRRGLRVPQAPCPRRRDDRGRPGRLVRGRLAVRGVPVARARGGTPRRRARVPAPVPRGAAASRGDHPGLRGAGVQLPARRGPGPRPVRPGRHHPARRGARPRCSRPPDDDAAADVVEPTLFTYPEHVVITDYKSSDVRDPAKARQRAKESLQLSIYAMGYEAMTGRLPDAVALHFLETGPRGDRAPWTASGSTRPASRSGRRRRGSGRGTSPRSRTYLACTWCAFREICPSSAAR